MSWTKFLRCHKHHAIFKIRKVVQLVWQKKFWFVLNFLKASFYNRLRRSALIWAQHLNKYIFSILNKNIFFVSLFVQKLTNIFGRNAKAAPIFVSDNHCKNLSQTPVLFSGYQYCKKGSSDQKCLVASYIIFLSTRTQNSTVQLSVTVTLSPQRDSLMRWIYILERSICTVLKYVEYRAAFCVFRTTELLTPPPPVPLASVSSPRTKGGGVDTRRPDGEGVGVNIFNISEDARHASSCLRSTCF